MQTLFARLIGLMPYLPEELALAAANIDEPSALCHLVASTLRLKTEEKQQILELADVEKRLRAVLVILNRELEVAELGSKIQSQVESEMESSQREYFLRQQLKAIQEELGEGDPEQAELEELREPRAEVNLSEEARKAIDRELARLEKLPSAPPNTASSAPTSSGSSACRGTRTTEDDLDLVRARKILDQDHFDLDKVKERILEYLAVSKLKNDLTGADPLFRRPARSGQDLARPIDRAHDRPQVRPHLGRGRPRRGRDPRAPPHVHRRACPERSSGRSATPSRETRSS